MSWLIDHLERGIAPRLREAEYEHPRASPRGWAADAEPGISYKVREGGFHPSVPGYSIMDSDDTLEKSVRGKTNPAAFSVDELQPHNSHSSAQPDSSYIGETTINDLDGQSLWSQHTD